MFDDKIGDLKMEGGLAKGNPEMVNRALEELAKAFALSVKDVEVRRFIKAEVGKKFDGDYEFLYQFARGHSFADGESFEVKLGKGYSKRFGLGDGISRVKELVKLIPRFNIAVPVNFERWDEESYVPLVAYRPVGVDDKLIEKVKAFDWEGKEYWLDAKKAPDFPVIVLGINERVDDNGNVRYFSLPNMRTSLDDEGGGGGFGGESSGVKTYKLKVVWFRCNNTDFEGWFGGAPEFYIHTYYWDIMRNNKTGPIRTDFYDIKSQGTYYVNRVIFNAGTIEPNLMVDKVKVEVFEDDGFLLGEDDTVELLWGYPYSNSPGIEWLSGDSMPLFFTEKWYFGKNNNVDLCLVWVY